MIETVVYQKKRNSLFYSHVHLSFKISNFKYYAGIILSHIFFYKKNLLIS